MSLKRGDYLTLLMAAFFLLISYSFNNSSPKPVLVISKQDQTWNLNDEMIVKFHLGFKRLTSSLMWISTILESDIDHYKKGDLNSWMFLRFNTISKLEPKFYENYAFGGVYLSIIKDDIAGASIIFNKGLEVFPLDYPLLRDSSYHFYFEAKDYNRAYQLTQTIKQRYPNKIALLGMITRLEAENGKLAEALKFLDEFQKSYPTGSIIGDKIFENRYALKAEIDLDCLNNLKLSECSKTDLKGVAYLKTDLGYIAQSKWKPYRKKSLSENK